MLKSGWTWSAFAVLSTSACPAWAADGESVSAITPTWWIAPIGALIGLFFAWVCYRLMIGAPKGNERMEEIAGYVREGAMAYLRQQYSRVGMVFIVLVVIFAALALMGWQNPFVPVAFLTGGFFSGLCGYILESHLSRISQQLVRMPGHFFQSGWKISSIGQKDIRR